MVKTYPHLAYNLTTVKLKLCKVSEGAPFALNRGTSIERARWQWCDILIWYYIPVCCITGVGVGISLVRRLMASE